MDINETINRIKKRVKDLTRHFPYSEEEINYLTLAYLAMYLLDPTIEDLIEEALATTFIYLTNNGLYDELHKLKLTEYANQKEMLDNSECIYEGYRILNNELIKEPFVMICKKDLRPNFLIDGVIHELKHAINELIPAIDGLDFYTGLTLIYRGIKIGDNLDETFNSYLSGIYVNILVSLKRHFIADPGISKIINSLEENDIYAYSYGNLAESCYHIFKSKKCFWSLYNAAIYKDMIPLYEAIDEAFNGELSWGEWLRILDEEQDSELERMEELIASENLTEERQIPRI